MPFEKFEKLPPPEGKNGEKPEEIREKIEKREKKLKEIREHLSNRTEEVEKEILEIFKSKIELQNNWGLGLSGENKRDVRYMEFKTGIKYEVLKEKRDEAKSIGEEMEIYTTYLLDKTLRKYFFIFRTTIFDDMMHGVDNLIIEKKTGRPICTFDIVTPAVLHRKVDEKLKEKIDKVLKKNIEGGAKLNYGIKIKEEKGEKKLIYPFKLSQVPIRYLALNEHSLRKSIEEANPLSEELSESEKNNLIIFLNELENQDKEHPDFVTERIEFLKKCLNECLKR